MLNNHIRKSIWINRYTVGQLQ